ncbi:MAG: hypothetical protein JXB39_01875 [Deltaproteobacteria bacterium]|nr:hypothetical protein [Deltaproteobacteria bacterium]
MTRLALVFTLAVAGSFGAALATDVPPQPPGPAEAGPTSYRIGETEVTTIGTYRVALAKTWEEVRDGKRVRVAWVSVVERGSTAGQKDLELTRGDPLVLGDRTLVVSAIVLESAGKPGHIVLE